MVPILELPETRWECPSCGLQDVTREARPHSRMHACRALAGFTTPMVRVVGRELRKNSVTHRVVERGDWIGSERVQLDGNGRPVMAILTERADGHDTHVYPPTATGAAR